MSAALAPAAMPPAVPVMELAAVTRIYAGSPPVTALAGVSFAIAAGELVAVVGPSGSGKTTLLHLMGTLDRPTSGVVRVAGLDVASLSDRQLAGLRATSIGFVFQQFFLAEHRTVLDNVADGLLYAGASLTERREHAHEALRLVGLDARPYARPTQLSGGQRQRVAIARALAGQPAIVLADEPTGNLDQATGQGLIVLLEQLNAAGTTIVIITHDQGIAARMPRQIERLDGRIVTDTIRAGRPAVLAPGIDTSVLVGFPAAEKYLGFDGHPSAIYVRVATSQVTAVDALLAGQANPQSPNSVDVSQPSAALVAQADAQSAFNDLFLGLGAVALLVGAVGVANIMVISVLERRSEIGLRRALGATRGHIRVQFLSEAILLAALGGAAGVAAGAAATAIYAHVKGWAIVIPAEAWAGGLAAALLIGAVAGLLPALRAARMSPTQALWAI